MFFDSWKEVKTSVLTGVWKWWIAALMGDFEGPAPQKRAIPAVGLARKLG